MLQAEVAPGPVQIYRATKTTFGFVGEGQFLKKSCGEGKSEGGPMLPYEGRQMLKVEGNWASDTPLIGKESLFVPIDQRLALLVAHLFEPAAPDSLLAWGFFNAAFAQKELIEDHKAEELARDMLEKQPRTKAEFDKRVKDDPQFAKDATARLKFFSDRPPLDERFNLYPVLRGSQTP